MATVEVFDPPMCCSTGVCGPSVNPALASFAADLSWLEDNGTTVRRHNLAQEPKAFAERELVRGLLAERGDDALPAVVVDGELRSSGRFPSREELAAWSLGSAAPAESLDAVTIELVAIGAAIGASCQSCFKVHYDEARRLGVGSGVIIAAVRVAQSVMDASASSVLDLAAKLLATDIDSLQGTNPGPAAQAEDASGATDAGCCGGGATSIDSASIAEGPSASSGCCGGDASVADVPLGATASPVSGCCD
jgi:AhpD family alkylhydroperoxidase